MQPLGETIIKNYKSPHDFQHDQKMMNHQGWTVQNVTTVQPRAGCIRILLIGFFALMFKPKPQIIVTYQRGLVQQQPMPQLQYPQQQYSTPQLQYPHQQYQRPIQQYPTPQMQYPSQQPYQQLIQQYPARLPSFKEEFNRSLEEAKQKRKDQFGF